MYSSLPRSSVWPSQVTTPQPEFSWTALPFAVNVGFASERIAKLSKSKYTGCRIREAWLLALPAELSSRNSLPVAPD